MVPEQMTSNNIKIIGLVPLILFSISAARYRPARWLGGVFGLSRAYFWVTQSDPIWGSKRAEEDVQVSLRIMEQAGYDINCFANFLEKDLKRIEALPVLKLMDGEIPGNEVRIAQGKRAIEMHKLRIAEAKKEVPKVLAEANAHKLPQLDWCGDWIKSQLSYLEIAKKDPKLREALSKPMKEAKVKMLQMRAQDNPVGGEQN
ncbi:hypothetical protein B0J14DRAFT_111216 [Halenospora varia]|nr:hypothetical protein B0J14DRAFT_111216 [Halenospora varia]